MSNDVAQKVRDALVEDGFEPEGILLETTASGLVGGVVISTRFDGKPQIERQRFLFNALEKHLRKNVLKQIVGILTMMPQEIDDVRPTMSRNIIERLQAIVTVVGGATTPTLETIIEERAKELHSGFAEFAETSPTLRWSDAGDSQDSWRLQAAKELLMMLLLRPQPSDEQRAWVREMAYSWKRAQAQRGTWNPNARDSAMSYIAGIRSCGYHTVGNELVAEWERVTGKTL